MERPFIPHLWFDSQAGEAAALYCSIFPDSKIEHIGAVRGTPSGDCETVSFQLAGQAFMAISAGPQFRFTPAVSFIVNYDPGRDPGARDALDTAWKKLADGGEVLMPLDAYPFSPRYGWVQDRFGLSWQLILSDPAGEPRPFIVPSLLFTDEVCGKAGEAAEFYRTVFEGSRVGQSVRYPAGMEPDREGTVMFTDFRLGSTWFAAMDSARAHGFAFNEAISFIVECEGQAEIDRYWERLSFDPAAEQCGWCKDRYGVSWQIAPAELQRMMRSEDHARVDRVTQAFLTMKKLDLAALRRAFDGA
ncbi:MAG: VOC family protein [Gammaproteobacteria bacterium]|jgi:predicted 3-demethylubiquinone-9 3-methyltransferase (glyoxalase superfamily)|nr:VOC family protein [Gammaproteobacteria bacterium]